MLHYIEQATKSGQKAKASELVFKKVSRRGFLAGTSAAFAIGAFASEADAFARYQTGGDGPTGMPNGLRYDPKIFVSIGKDGTVTIVTIRSEMGTGARTSLPMVMADEMMADWSRVKLVQAEGDEPKYGNQDTDGSRSMRHHIQSHRQMGASVKLMLARAAAEKAGVDVSAVQVGVHEVTAGGTTYGFGDLAEAAMAQDVPAFEELSFVDEKDFRYIGKGDVAIYDLHDITTGKAVYGADVSLPGMKVAAIARPPVVGQPPLKYDAAAAWQIPGVEQVMGLPISIMPAKFAPLGGIAVIASNTHAAIAGRDALEIEWGDSPHSSYTSSSFTDEMRAEAKKPGQVLRKEGDPEGAFASAAKVFGQEDSQAHMAHAMMEPPAAVANVANGKAEIWAPVQSPYGARLDLAAALNMDPADVTVNVTLLGGGFGRKSKCDFAIEAALPIGSVKGRLMAWKRTFRMELCAAWTSSPRSGRRHSKPMGRNRKTSQPSRRPSSSTPTWPGTPAARSTTATWCWSSPPTWWATRCWGHRPARSVRRGCTTTPGATSSHRRARRPWTPRARVRPARAPTSAP